ncbi:MAG: NAD(P)H-binding protein [Terricaulis sp.]
MAKNNQPVVLVTGASGHLGSRAVEALLERGGAHVIAATRNPEKIAHLAAKGAEIRRADFDDPNSLKKAFKGIDRLLLVSTDALDEPGKRLRQHRAAIAAAEKAGVRHIVYTSAPATAPGKVVMGDHFWTEQALASSKLGWTILRNHLYADLLLGSLPQAIASGSFVTAFGANGRNYVTRDDAARAAAGALLDTFDGQRILDVTGPTPLTGADIADIASSLSGKPVNYVAVSSSDLKAGLTSAGFPSVLVDVLVQFDSDAAEGHHGITTTAVRDLSGHAPQSVADFLAAKATALKPQQAAA